MASLIDPDPCNVIPFTMGHHHLWNGLLVLLYHASVSHFVCACIEFDTEIRVALTCRFALGIVKIFYGN